MSVLRVLQGIYIVLMGTAGTLFVKDYKKNKETDVSPKQQTANTVIGFVVNFFDALGIGSFAPSMAAYRIGKLVPDKLIPGTLNVGVMLPVTVEALIFMTVIEVDIFTLVAMVSAGIIGSLIGVSFAKRLPEKTIQLCMAIGLALAAFFILAGKFGWMPVGGEDIGLAGFKLIIGVVFNFLFGVFLTLGIGNYAPCMALVYMLGMNPSVAFPIMMCSGSFCASFAGIRFIKEGIYHRKASLGMTLGGVPGVLIAVYVVRSMPISTLQWLVFVVLVYTSITLFISAFKKNPPETIINGEDVQ